MTANVSESVLKSGLLQYIWQLSDDNVRFPWSSALAYCVLTDNYLLADNSSFSKPENWQVAAHQLK